MRKAVLWGVVALALIAIPAVVGLVSGPVGIRRPDTLKSMRS